MKNKLSKGFSENPKHSISERFKASTHGFYHFLKKFESASRSCHYRAYPDNLDPRVEPEDDKGMRLSTSILKHLSNVILGFIPRIHAKHYPSLDTRVEPEDDNQWNFIKGLDVVGQCAAFLERRVQSGTRVRKAQAVTRQTNLIGRSMIEMLGVLAIIGVLSVGGIAGYSKAMEQFRINKMIDNIAMIITNIRTLYIQQKDFNGLITSIVSDMGILPDSVQYDSRNGDISFNPGIFHGVGWIYPAGTDRTSDNYSFAISLAKLTQTECLALSTKDWGSASSGIKTMVIGQGYISGSYFNTSSLTNETGNFSAGSLSNAYYAKSSKLPFSPATASLYCNCGTDCGVVLVFDK